MELPEDVLELLPPEEPIAEKEKPIEEKPQTPPTADFDVLQVNEESVAKQVTQATQYLEKELQILRSDLEIKEK